jgi:hypothetical protein
MPTDYYKYIFSFNLIQCFFYYIIILYFCILILYFNDVFLINIRKRLIFIYGISYKEVTL